MNEEGVYKILNTMKEENKDSIEKWVCENYPIAEKEKTKVESVLETLESRGVETSEAAIYSIDEDDDSFIVCIDDDQMIIKKRTKWEYSSEGTYKSGEL